MDRKKETVVPDDKILPGDISASNQLIDKKAEKYIRESGNIEDLPAPEEEDEEDIKTGLQNPANKDS